MAGSEAVRVSVSADGVHRKPMTPLFREVHRWMALPFAWGETDCCMVVCDWVLAVRGFDPGADLRFAYHSPGECQRLTGWFTDPVTTFACRMGPLPRVQQAMRGDVGILRMDIGGGVMRPHGALCLGRSWAVKGERGVVSFDRPCVMAAWGVGYVD